MTREADFFSIAVKCSHIGPGEFHRKFIVEGVDREHFSSAFGLLELNHMVVEVLLRRRQGSETEFDLKGVLEAEIGQQCVVCLEVVRRNLIESFSASFIPNKFGVVKKDVFDPEDPDRPETYSGDCIELGKIVWDYLSLVIDPHPRHDQLEDAQVCVPIFENAKAVADLSPFAGIDKLLKSNNKK